VERRFFNPSQPQTIQVSVFLLYANVVVALLFRTGDSGIYYLAVAALTRSSLTNSLTTLLGNVIAIFVVAGSFAAAYLIANEKKVGWRLGVVVAAIPIVALLLVLVIGNPRISLVDAISIQLLFDVALLVALLHDQTRSYEKVWFK
jgi:hypothetical protein